MSRLVLLSLVVALSLAIFAAVGFAADSKCSQRMTITDEKTSVSAYVFGNLSFDDIGCAVTWRDKQCATDQASFDGSAKAHDYLTGAEVLFVNAYFVRAPGIINSPLGYGIVAFAERASAEKFAADKGAGKPITFSELVALGLKFKE